MLTSLTAKKAHPILEIVKACYNSNNNKKITEKRMKINFECEKRTKLKIQTRKG